MKFGNRLTKFLALVAAVSLTAFLYGCSQESGSWQSGGENQATVNYANNCNTFVSESDSTVFVSDTTKITAVSKADGSTVEIYSTGTNQYMAIPAFEAFGGRVYFVTMDSMLYSVAADGTDLQSARLPRGLIIDHNTMVDGYTYDGNLYFVFDNVSTQSVWQVSENPLSLTEVDASIATKMVTADGSVFVLETDPATTVTHLYRQTADGKTEITGAKEAIMSNMITSDENNLFYAAHEVDDMALNVYKVSFDGSEKSVLASVPIDMFKYIYYDSENVYIDTFDGVLMFNKETGRQTDAYTPDNADFEIADGKIFFYMDGFYADMQTRQTVRYK